LDLVEAVALGHDVGHPPFGHEGEGYLSRLSEEHGEGKFAHPWQSCRLFSEIEPLNLGLLVYDGFLCHDGGMCGTEFAPKFGKTWDDHFAEKEQKLRDPDANIWPGTLEGCLVKMCDTISYVGRDIEDAISLGILTRDEIPETILGKSNRHLLSVVAKDVIACSYGKEMIAMSQEVFDALQVLRSFNFEKIYTHPRLKVESEKIERSYRVLFTHLLNDWNACGEKSYLWKCYLRTKPEKYVEGNSPVRLVIDYIAGMTDSYFVKTLQNLVIPKRIDL
jgi:dGTPase